MKYDVNSFKDRFERWKNGESYWDLRNINLNNTTNIPSSISQDYITSYVDDYFKNYDNGKDDQLVEYIKAIENPNNVGYNPKTNTWKRVRMEGFDPNTYGYGLDHRYFDKSILNDDGSMDHDVMLDQIDKKLKYYEGAAKRNGVDKNRISDDDYLLSIGAMYRGDAKDVYNAVAKYNILKPGEFKKEIYNKYKQQGLNERIKQSEKFFKNKKQDSSFIKNYNLIDDLKKQNSFIPKFDNGKTGYVRQNNNPIMFDDQGNLVDQITGEKGTMLLPNVTIRPNRLREYKSAFDGSLQNFVDVTNALSGGILNRASATQNLKAAYDAYKYLKGDIDKQDLINSVVYGNSGIVSDNYYDKHPIISSLLNFAGDVFVPYGLYKGSTLGKSYIDNTKRRAIEVAMRTSSDYNGLHTIQRQLKKLIDAKDKDRLSAIGKYILTGKRTGSKGYYNSLADSFNGNVYYYDGFKDDLFKSLPTGDSSDLIDAFLYNKQIDPKYGLIKVRNEYGPHEQYINQNYRNKNIPVYRVKLDNSDYYQIHGDDANKITDKSKWRGQNNDDFPESISGDIVDVGGHLEQSGIYNGDRVVRKQDIWKFNPGDYVSKYPTLKDQPLWKRWLINKGLQQVNKLGTPVITKTNWYTKNISDYDPFTIIQPDDPLMPFNKGKNKPGYYQFMENLADKKAQEWTTVPFLPLNPNIVLTQMLNDNTYNYRQWYNNLPFGATVNDFDGHFPDTYKTVYHPTFSNESMYSPNNNQYIPNTQYNPNNITGGRWDGNNYILSKDQIDNNWDVDRTVDYLLKADPGVKLIIPQYNSGKSIHIKKENRGKFTAAANRHGMSVQAFARKVLNAPKGKYSSTLRKRANFAKNAAKWHK